MALCLLGLNRDGDARAAMAQLVDLDPRFEFDVADASPRVRDLLRGVRAERLPKVVQARYAGAKQAFDAGDFGAAATRFADVRGLPGRPGARGRRHNGRPEDAHAGVRRPQCEVAGRGRIAATGGVSSHQQRARERRDLRRTGADRERSGAPPPAGGTAGAAADIPRATARAAGSSNPWPISESRPSGLRNSAARRGTPSRATITVVIDDAGKVTSARTVVAIQPLFTTCCCSTPRGAGGISPPRRTGHPSRSRRSSRCSSWRRRERDSFEHENPLSFWVLGSGFWVLGSEERVIHHTPRTHNPQRLQESPQIKGIPGPSHRAAMPHCVLGRGPRVMARVPPDVSSRCVIQNRPVIGWPFSEADWM